jgi:ubiquinone biosynthesis monooxygenase Coq7
MAHDRQNRNHPQSSTRGNMRMPGRLSAHGWLDRALRVDQAGEHGATRIYAGQSAVLDGHARTAAAAAEVRHMGEQERRHLARFDELLNAHRVRPTLLSPLWHVAGFALGAGTALLGQHAAMACTVAVEEAITEHYAEQRTHLGTDQPDVAAAIVEFAEEEEQHLHTALRLEAEQTPLYGLLSGAIKFGCKMAIRLSERI